VCTLSVLFKIDKKVERLSQFESMANQFRHSISTSHNSSNHEHGFDVATLTTDLEIFTQLATIEDFLPKVCELLVKCVSMYHSWSKSRD